MRRLLLAVVSALLVLAPAAGRPAPAREPGACALVPNLLYRGQPVYYGDCVTARPAPSETATPTETSTAVPTDTDTPVPPTDTPAPTDTPVPSETPLPAATATPAGPVTPYPDAPLCPDTGAAHDNSTFHTLWDATRGCHYDHEHGTDPFTGEVAAAFPGFDLRALLGGVGVGHTNPSSPMENTHKHGGFKWDVRLVNYRGCVGREGVPTGVDAFAVQYHAFGDYAVEFESRVHSAVALLRQCQADNPTDYGYVYVVQHQDYGQRTAPYQGVVLPYPDTPASAYDPAREPYMAVTCFGGPPGSKCAKYPTRQAMLGGQAESTWISEPANISGSSLFFLLFRLRDSYQALDAADTVYPFTFAWLCSGDGGGSYDPAGCRYNNTTTRVHELGGEIPAAWDNLAGFDTDPRVGRVTAEGYVSAYGVLNLACSAPAAGCFPIKLVGAFTGRYGTGLGLTPEKTSAFDPRNLPERDLHFCGGVPCGEFDAGAVPSGWVGPTN